MKAIAPPTMISNRRFSKFKFAAAAKGPGVGGTKTWGANKPVDNATVSPTSGVFVCFERVLLSCDKMTKAASQNTGIDTK